MRRFAVSLAFVVLASCKKADDGVTPADSPSAPPKSDPGIHAAPVVLHVTADADAGVTDVDVDIAIDVAAPGPAPATLRIVVPSGASLTSGNATETIDVSHAGTQHRKAHVQSPTPLTETNHVTVVLESEQAASGFRAERRWPPKAEIPGPHAGLRPPRGRPPAPGASSP